MSAVTARRVALEDRVDFLPQQLPGCYLRFEMQAYAIMGRACDAYQGGLWEFYELDNSGFVIVLEGDDPLRLVTEDTSLMAA